MKKFFNYFVALSKKLLSKANLIPAIIAGLSFYFDFRKNLVFGDLPKYLRVAALVLIFIISNHELWKENKIEIDKLRNELKETKNRVPRYSVSLSAQFVSFDFEKAKQVFRKEIRQAEEKMNSYARNLIYSISPFQEKSDAEYHLEKIAEYEKEYKNKVIKLDDLSLSASKADENVIVRIKSTDGKLITCKNFESHVLNGEGFVIPVERKEKHNFSRLNPNDKVEIDPDAIYFILDSPNKTEVPKLFFEISSKNLPHPIKIEKAIRFKK
ncbi:hypothetical protein IJG20_02220 [Candidatus Saccharibacteria bacterium]|nr:hypothetical protein [Candidatus Saccharibacteria bacterium]